MSASGGDLLEVSVAVDGETAEAVYALFEEYGDGAVVEIRVADPDRAGEAGPTTTWVRTYLPADDIEARRRVEVGLWHLSQIHPIPDAVLRRLAEANWAEAWKAHFTPLHLAGGFVVVPAWIDPAEAAPDPGAHVIRLDPGMAFGTGLHPTTQLCLAALADLVRPGMRVLDVGTGSGILAIAAARLGAAYVRGVDIDARAIEIAATNADLNAVAIDLRPEGLKAGDAGEVDATAGFDVVVANILAGTIVDLAPALASQARPGGILITCGILVEQADSVGAALAEAGAVVRERRTEGDWVAVIAERAATARSGGSTAADGSMPTAGSNRVVEAIPTAGATPAARQGA